MYLITPFAEVVSQFSCSWFKSVRIVVDTFEAKWKAVRYIFAAVFRVVTCDTGVYLLVLYRDQQILYRLQALIWCPETRAARLKFQRWTLCLGRSCSPRRGKSSKSRGRVTTSCQYRQWILTMKMVSGSLTLTAVPRGDPWKCWRIQVPFCSSLTPIILASFLDPVLPKRFSVRCYASFPNLHKYLYYIRYFLDWSFSNV